MTIHSLQQLHIDAEIAYRCRALVDMYHTAESLDEDHATQLDDAETMLSTVSKPIAPYNSIVARDPSLQSTFGQT